jgi:hypothetical protein
MQSTSATLSPISLPDRAASPAPRPRLRTSLLWACGCAVLLLGVSVHDTQARHAEALALEQGARHVTGTVVQLDSRLRDYRRLLAAYYATDSGARRSADAATLVAQIDSAAGRVDAALTATDVALRGHLPAFARDVRWLVLIRDWQELAAQPTQRSAEEVLVHAERVEQRIRTLAGAVSAATQGTARMAMSPQSGSTAAPPAAPMQIQYTAGTNISRGTGLRR